MKTSISVIICTYNRAESLKTVLESLLKQKRDQDFEFEIIVIDNRSTDSTKTVIESFSNTFKGQLKYLFQSQKGKSLSLNMAIREAKGDILVFTDDDVIIDEQWISHIYECFKKYDCDAVGGRVLPIYPDKTPLWVKNNAVKLSGSVVIYDYGDQTFQLDQQHYPFIGANFAFKNKIFTDCGLFNPNLGPGTTNGGEDTDFIKRIITKGKSLYYCGEALVWHPLDLKRLKLNHVASWNIALGRYAAYEEIKHQKNQFISYWGIPRWLLRGIMIDTLRLCAAIFNQVAWYDAWRSFFRKLGMIQKYREIKKVTR